MKKEKLAKQEAKMRIIEIEEKNSNAKNKVSDSYTKTKKKNDQLL